VAIVEAELAEHARRRRAAVELRAAQAHNARRSPPAVTRELNRSPRHRAGVTREPPGAANACDRAGLLRTSLHQQAAFERIGHHGSSEVTLEAGSGERPPAAPKRPFVIAEEDVIRPPGAITGTVVEVEIGLGRIAAVSVALSRCATAHPLRTRFAKVVGASFSSLKATMRPNPRVENGRLVSRTPWPDEMSPEKVGIFSRRLRAPTCSNRSVYSTKRPAVGVSRTLFVCEPRPTIAARVMALTTK
jgi:hypothetical protein